MSTAIMVTGGIDSTLLMYEFASRNPVLLSVNYGQAVWDLQQDLIRYHIRQLPEPLKFVEIPMALFPWQKTPGLFEEGWKPEDKNPLEAWDDIPHKSYFIEGRNALMLCYALAYCSHNKIDELIVGYEYEKNEWENIRSTKMVADDTSPHFLDTMNILAMSGFSHVVRIRAPFYERRWDKSKIIRECLEWNLNLDKMYSCYFAGGPCHVCDNCLLRDKIEKEIQNGR